MTIKEASNTDLLEITKLAILLWPDAPFVELNKEFGLILKKQTEKLFVAKEANQLIGFAHCCLRYEYVEGTDGSPVGYLEGIYVLPAYRKMKIASRLLECSEDWARKKGCTEFASDCELNNIDSFAFHLKVGFEEVNRIICFKKKL